jgi:septum site-determining protein MinC
LEESPALSGELSPELAEELAKQPQVEAVPDKDLVSSLIELPNVKHSRGGSSSKGEPNEALFVKTTFRSGESINYHGDVIVLADVNPGAEIIAEGDIVVFGSLRGMAHAGSSGDTKATIIALDLNSPRIQIGPYTGLAPSTKSGSQSSRDGPKIAYSKRRSVYVSPYAGRFARYSRGILYDG